MIEISRLAPSEFDLLAHISDGFIPDPERSIAIAANNENGMIARLFLMAPAHVEGIFIEPAWRGGPLFKQMMEAMEIEARGEGISKLFAYAVSEEIGDYLKRRCGYTRLPWSVWSKEISCLAR